MTDKITPAVRSSRKRHMLAMVVGTALSGLAPLPAGPLVSDLSRYCNACWRNARLDPACWADCTQEVFCRLLERLEPAAWERALTGDGDERREFLRAIDAVRKRTQRQRRGLPLPGGDLADRSAVQRQARAEQREAVWAAAAALLSDRQRQILAWSFDGWSVQEAAAQLQLPAERVSDEKYKAIQKLRKYFASLPESAA